MQDLLDALLRETSMKNEIEDKLDFLMVVSQLFFHVNRLRIPSKSTKISHQFFTLLEKVP